MSLCFLTSNWLFHSSNFLSIFFFSKCSHGTTAEATLSKFRCLNTKHFKLERPYLRRKQMIFWVNPRQCSFLQNELYIFCRYTYRHTNVALKKPQTKQEIIIKVISHSKFFFRVLVTRQIISPEHQWERQQVSPMNTLQQEGFSSRLSIPGSLLRDSWFEVKKEEKISFHRYSFI